MRVAVVRNLERGASEAALVRSNPAPAGGDGVEATVAGLREQGHTVMVAEGGPHLLDTLGQFMPAAWCGGPSGFVFNLAPGLRGEMPRAHVPAMLEMAGIPYTGASPLGHALSADTVVARALLQLGGVPVAPWRVAAFLGEDAQGLRYPLTVRPRDGRPELPPRTVLSPGELADALHRVLAAGDAEALVEERAGTAVISAALVGNDDELELLPLVERADDSPGQLLVAGGLPAPLVRRIGAVAVATFRACRLRDYAVIDLRVDAAGEPQVVGVDGMPALSRDAGFVHAAVAGGYSRSALVSRILDVSHTRYFGVDAPRFDVPVARRPGIWRPSRLDEVS